MIEAYFYMWRYTHEPKYREWAWEAVQVSNGKNVTVGRGDGVKGGEPRRYRDGMRR